MNVIDPSRRQVLPWSDPAYVADPYPWYDRARREYPVYRDTDGTFVITRYDDVMKYGKTASLSIVDPDWVPKGAWAALSNTVLGIDPPEHTRMRRLGNKWFTPKLCKRWSEGAERAVRDYIAGLQDGEVFDANMYLGVGPSHVAMCMALGFPEDDFEPAIFSMHKTMSALSAVAGPDHDKAAAEAFAYIRARVEKMLDDKRADPGDGMADALLALEAEGELSSDEVIETLMLFWASGGHNPSYIIGSSIEYFARNPEIWDIYRNEPEKRAAFINEIHRLYPPELSFARWTQEPMEIHGQQIAVGERVKFIIDAANRDPEVFPEADAMVLDRPKGAAMHMSFGMGPHQCAGQIISRTEVETVLGTLAELVERFEMKGEPEMDNTDRSRAYVRLPVSIVKRSA
ncbi:cytochrome P450 [Poseidonocella sp. HB161398]|uniref:cytochrome P450 n=1 Tax=Poseidonocella sp. HB161398 TaxID=2320855 RepID=UPI001108EF0B|nr:cytochrome P450 [Poseidonocella sp. HB161398]